MELGLDEIMYIVYFAHNNNSGKGRGMQIIFFPNALLVFLNQKRAGFYH